MSTHTHLPAHSWHPVSAEPTPCSQCASLGASSRRTLWPVCPGPAGLQACLRQPCVMGWDEIPMGCSLPMPGRPTFKRRNGCGTRRRGRHDVSTFAEARCTKYHVYTLALTERRPSCAHAAHKLCGKQQPLRRSQEGTRVMRCSRKLCLKYSACTCGEAGGVIKCASTLQQPSLFESQAPQPLQVCSSAPANRLLYACCFMLRHPSACTLHAQLRGMRINHRGCLLQLSPKTRATRFSAVATSLTAPCCQSRTLLNLLT